MPLSSTLQTGVRLLRAIALLLVSVLSLLVLFPSPAQATIRQIDEAPGQTLYQIRTTLKDQQGNRWQAIAFKRHQPDGSEVLNVRLVGFPGAAKIDRPQPLKLIDSLGHTFTAPDTSAQIFTDASAPEPYIGQYDLRSILTDLQPALPLEVDIPMQDGKPAVLLVAPPVLKDWQDLLDIG